MVWFAVFGLGAVAGVVNTLTGFGAGIIMMMGLPSFFDMLTAPGISTASTTPMTAVRAWKLRRHTDWGKLVLPVSVYVCCCMAAIRVAGNMDLRLLKLLLSIFLMALSAYLLLLSDRLRIRPTARNVVLCSAFSGLCSGWFGIGGPLMALYFLSVTDTKESYIASIQFFFAFTNLFNILYRLRFGIYTREVMLLVVTAALGTAVGWKAGLLIFDRIDRERMKKIVYLFLAVAGALNLMGCV